MKRRDFIISAALLAASCAAPMAAGPAGFASDRISVVTQGSGPDVVLVHGLGSSREVWRETVSAVPGYRYHLVQMQGFGGTPIGPGNASGPVAAPVAEEIARYIAEAGLNRPAVIGHSMGGWIAMALAARHPDAASKIMVVDMLPFMGAMFGPPGTTAESIRPTADQIRDRMIANSAAMREQTITATMATMIKTENRRAEAIRQSVDSDVGMSARSMHELIATDIRPELANIKVPVTVLYVRSPAAPITDEQMDAFYKLSYANVPQARLIRISDAYHFIMWDQPARFAEEVRTFLAG
jgi:pimeloyl-ACP methyl ester carboxylesterase